MPGGWTKKFMWLIQSESDVSGIPDIMIAAGRTRGSVTPLHVLGMHGMPCHLHWKKGLLPVVWEQARKPKPAVPSPENTILIPISCTENNIFVAAEKLVEPPSTTVKCLSS